MIHRHRMFAVAAPALAVAAVLAVSAYSPEGGTIMKTAASAQTNQPPIACNPGAFTAEERERWQKLGDRFIRSARARRELSNGFAFDLDRTPDTLRDLTAFVELESRCCPFVDFTVRVPAGGHGVTLEMTGRKGVKEMLADELGRVGT